MKTFCLPKSFRHPGLGRVCGEVILCEVEHNHFQFAIHSFSLFFFLFPLFLIEPDSGENAASSAPSRLRSRRKAAGKNIGASRLRASDDATSDLPRDNLR